MPNNYFQFKKFRVDQEMSGMKVTTEGCILGGWVNAVKAKNVLDIGAGTGLLSLMIAQNSSASIDAVEIDNKAANQAKKNFQNSNWSSRLDFHITSIQNFKTHKKYDLIVSNPPFFSNHLKNHDRQKNNALHDDLLNQNDLLVAINTHLSKQGIAYVLLPEHESKVLENRALEMGLYLKQKLEIYNQPSGRIFRVISKFTKQKTEQTKEHLVIRDGTDYTEEFKNLLKDYYLAF